MSYIPGQDSYQDALVDYGKLRGKGFTERELAAWADRLRSWSILEVKRALSRIVDTWTHSANPPIGSIIALLPKLPPTAPEPSESFKGLLWNPMGWWSGDEGVFERMDRNDAESIAFYVLGFDHGGPDSAQIKLAETFSKGSHIRWKALKAVHVLNEKFGDELVKA